MTDVFTAAKRSQVMSRIRSKNTGPEVKVRKALHRMGYRFRLHSASLPGHPDIVLPRYRVVLEVRGCFWHGHSCLRGRVPSGAYWGPKILRTQNRDRVNMARLRALGWRAFSLWECRVRRYSPSQLDNYLCNLLQEAEAE